MLNFLNSVGVSMQFADLRYAKSLSYHKSKKSSRRHSNLFKTGEGGGTALPQESLYMRVNYQQEYPAMGKHTTLSMLLITNCSLLTIWNFAPSTTPIFHISVDVLFADLPWFPNVARHLYVTPDIATGGQGWPLAILVAVTGHLTGRTGQWANERMSERADGNGEGLRVSAEWTTPGGF